MPISINLKHVTEEHLNRLIEFFNAQSSIGNKIWSKKITYFFSDGAEFFFENDVFQRERKDGNTGIRYEVISNKPSIGFGGYGEIFKIKGTVALGKNTLRFKKEGKEKKRRVVKVQKHDSKYNPLSLLQNEYALAQRANHLSIKKPTIIANSSIDQQSYTVMDLMLGHTLQWVSCSPDLSTHQCSELSKALISALKEQVTSKGIIHRDIKPGNILVDLGPPIVVNIVDYGCSMDIKNPDGICKGTYGYRAPEVLNKPWETCEKSDVFSLGRTLIDLWGMHWDINNKPIQYILDKIGTIDINMKNVISDMLEIDLNNRITIDEVISRLTFVCIPNKQQLTATLSNLSVFAPNKITKFPRESDICFSDNAPLQKKMRIM